MREDGSWRALSCACIFNRRAARSRSYWRDARHSRRCVTLRAKCWADQFASVLDSKVERLQDLIRAAVNEASRRVDEELANQMKNLAGGLPGLAGLKIPGLF